VAATVRRAFGLDCRGVVNPYGDGQAARRIHDVVAGISDFQPLVRKRFHDLKGGGA
jgi:UDP-N-acetylglucosamine 2-epimerase (non-hydrolysing)/GDP/UDP-N,N'-diacetylbacillosamine 2-epimerase (hydrolysing)